MQMNEYIKQVLKDKQLKMITVARGTGINECTLRTQLHGHTPLTLSNLIMIAEYIAKVQGKYTHDCLSEFMQYNSDFQNAIRRDQIRFNKQAKQGSKK